MECRSTATLSTARCIGTRTVHGGDNLEPMFKRVEIDTMATESIGHWLWGNCSGKHVVLASPKCERACRWGRCAAGSANLFPASPRRDYNLRRQCHVPGVSHDSEFTRSDKTLRALVPNLLDLHVSSSPFHYWSDNEPHTHVTLHFRS
jgi:hypothetical protein